MSYISNKDFLIEVMKGNVAGHSMVHKFGRNNAIPNGSWAHVLSEKTDIWFEALGDGATCDISVDFELLLIDN